MEETEQENFNHLHNHDGVNSQIISPNSIPDLTATEIITGLGFSPENVANKSTDGTMSADSTILYPSQSAVVSYVASQLGTQHWTYISSASISGTGASPAVISIPSNANFAVIVFTGTDNGNGGILSAYFKNTITIAKTGVTTALSSIQTQLPGAVLESRDVTAVWGTSLTISITVSSGGTSSVTGTVYFYT